MLEASVIGLKYHRLLYDEHMEISIDVLPEQFDYSFIVAYSNFNHPRYQVIPKKSCMIDLSDGIESTFSKFHATTRNEIRRSDKIDGLKFVFGYQNDFDTFYQFHKTCEEERGWYPTPPDEIRNSLLFAATYDGELISGISCYSNNSRIRVGRIFSRKRGKMSERLNNLVYGCAAKRIVFNICEYAINHGIQQLDLGGIDLVDPLKAGIAKFKLSFGSTEEPVLLARYASPLFLSKEQDIRAAGLDLT